MSKAFVESFFPVVTRRLLHQQPFLDVWLNRMFPDDVALQCPEISVAIRNSGRMMMMMIRNPVLGVWAVFGVAIGIIGCRHCYRNYQRNHGRYLYWQSPRSDDKHKYKNNGSVLESNDNDSAADIMSWWWWWSMAFGWFAVMNVTALPLHCFLDVADGEPASLSPSFAEQASFLVNHKKTLFIWCCWSLDCFSTGLSSICIIVALLRRRQEGISLTMVLLLLLALLGGAIVWQASDNDNDNNVAEMASLVIELWYLLPTTLAGYVTLGAIFSFALDARRKRLHKTPFVTLAPISTSFSSLFLPGTSLLLLGGMIIVGGTVGDAYLCRATGQVLYDGLMAATCVFLGSDMAFVGLYLWLTTTAGERKGVQQPQEKALSSEINDQEHRTNNINMNHRTNNNKTQNRRSKKMA